MKVKNLMGKIVLVDRVYERTYPYNGKAGNEHKKEWKAVHAEGRPGWVVGERWIQNGATIFGFGYDDPPVWKQSGHSLHCLLVCYWPNLKPVRVPLDGYRLAPPTVRPYPPDQHWDDRARSMMRGEMKDWPRDEKGRWVAK